MKAILQAPVDLLWNGGIGTYVKGRRRDPRRRRRQGQRRDPGRRPRACGPGASARAATSGSPSRAGSSTRCSGAGERREGGRINTDFIDNSAGVDTSDHEVNIKILLDRVVKDGDLTEKQRNTLLAEMTDEVADLVLRDNYEQNLALANAVAHAPSLLHVHEDWMRRLERDGVLNRELEGLPSPRQVRRLLERGRGAERARSCRCCMAWTKIVLAEELLACDLPDDPYLELDLRAYFPTADARGLRGRRSTRTRCAARSS